MDKAAIDTLKVRASTWDDIALRLEGGASTEFKDINEWLMDAGRHARARAVECRAIYRAELTGDTDR